MTDWLAAAQAWLGAHPQWLGASILIVACIECLAVAGLLVPGTVVLFALGMMAGSGALSLGQTLLLAYIGGLLGDALSYGLGRRFHHNIRRLPVLRDNPQWLAAAEGFFHRHGVMSLLVGRYIGPLRPTLPLVAGMLDMPLLRFAAVSMVAAVGWSVAYLAPGWVAGAALRLTLPPGFWPQVGGVALALAALVLGASQLAARGQRRAGSWVALACALLLALLVWGWPRLHALDDGLSMLLQTLRAPVSERALRTLQRLFEPTPLLAVAAVMALTLLRWGQARAAALAAGTVGAALALDAALAAWLPDLLQRPPAGRPLAALLSAPQVPAPLRDQLLIPLAAPQAVEGGLHGAALMPVVAGAGAGSGAGAALPGCALVALWLVMGVLAGRGQPPRLRLTWLAVAAVPAVVLLAGRVLVGAQWPTAMLAAGLGGAAVCAAGVALAEWREPLPGAGPRVAALLLPACLGLLALGAAGVFQAL